MPTFRFTGPDEEKRQELIKSILPKETIVSEFLQPRLMEAMEDVLIKALKQEIEIYKAFPKQGKYEPNTFDTRTPDRCYMGQGFKANGMGVEGWYDADLRLYRKAIGTLAHSEWGDCTLLEIWGGDHFESHKEMVVGVMEYANGLRSNMPDVKFYVNPLYKNSASGKTILSIEMKDQHKNAEHMTKLAMYIEIRDRMKKSGTTNCMNLAPLEEDDPPPKPQRNFDIDYDAEYEEEEDD